MEQKTDHVVLAVGVHSSDELAKERSRILVRLHTIGDARKVGRIAPGRTRRSSAWKLV